MSITIKPVRFAENGFMTRPFALGGEGAEGLDPAVKYRSCLQNWVIDCSVCGYVYDPAEHDGVAFEDLPADWRCPRCKQPKDKFNRA